MGPGCAPLNPQAVRLCFLCLQADLQEQQASSGGALDELKLKARNAEAALEAKLKEVKDTADKKAAQFAARTAKVRSAACNNTLT